MVETEFIASIVKRDVFYDCWGLVAAVVVGGGWCVRCCCTPVARDGTIGEKDITNSVVTC